MSNLVRKVIGPALLVTGVGLCLASNRYFDASNNARYSLIEAREDVNRISHFEPPSDEGKSLGLGILGMATLIPGMIYLLRRDCTYKVKSKTSE